MPAKPDEKDAPPPPAAPAKTKTDAPTVLYRAGGVDIPLVPVDVKPDGKADLYDPEETGEDGKPVLKISGCPRADKPTEGHYLNPNPPKEKVEE